MKSFFLGKRDYLPVLRMQNYIFQAKISRQSDRRRGKTTLPLLPDVNLLVEHRCPVYTLGRRDTSCGLSPLLQNVPIVDASLHMDASSSFTESLVRNTSSLPLTQSYATEEAEKRNAGSLSNVQVVKTKRGGGITYHGPGQLTMYPIANIQLLWKECRNSKKCSSPIEWFSAVLEEAMMSVATCFGIGTHVFKTGVWTNPFECIEARKLGSIGLQLGSNWVSMHGAGFNVSTDLAHFDQIVICELPGRKATSIEAEISLRKLRDDFNFRMRCLQHTKTKFKGGSLLGDTISVENVSPLLHHFFLQHLDHPNAEKWEDTVDLSSCSENEWERAVYSSLPLCSPLSSVVSASVSN